LIISDEERKWQASVAAKLGVIDVIATPGPVVTLYELVPPKT
jgi:hypothetical protein